MPNRASLAALSCLALIACAEDLYEVDDGSAEQRRLEIPLTISPNASFEMESVGTGPITVEVSQSGTSSTLSIASIVVTSRTANTEAQTQSSDESTAPSLLVETQGTDEYTHLIKVLNLGDNTLKGILVIDTPQQKRCDDGTDTTYLTWIKIYGEKLREFGPNFTPAEQTEIDALLSSKPCMDLAIGDAGYGAWLELYDAKLSAFGPNFTPQELNELDLVDQARAQLEAVSGLSYVAWLETYRSRFDAFQPNFTPQEDGYLDHVRAAQPNSFEGESEAAYLAWLAFLAPYAESVGSNMTPQEQSLIEKVLETRVCSPGSQDAMDRFLEVLANSGAAISLLESAGPNSCP